MNEDGRAAGKEHKDFQLNVLYFNNPCGETELQRTFNRTWIQTKKKHIKKDGSQEDSPHGERAGAEQLSVDKPEHGLKFMGNSS